MSQSADLDPPDVAPPPLPRAFAGVLLFVATCALLAFPYIDWEASADLGPWHADVPLADLAGLILLGLVGASVLLSELGLGRRLGLPARLPSLLLPPGGIPYTIFLLAALGALPAALDQQASLHTFLRKPLFLWLAWGGGLAWAAAYVGDRRTWHRILTASATICASILLVSSASRIAGGSGLASAAVAHLTANQKTLAVALAPLLPLVLGLRRPTPRWAVASAVLIGSAIVASASRSALVTAAVGLTFLVRVRGRRVAELPGVIPALALGGLALALYAPLLTQSVVQLDALRSRHSLDVRAWMMWTAHPLFGMGAGTATLYEMVEFPLYRVNGVDAHGALQKVASEEGLIGLIAWLWATLSVWRRLRADRTESGVILMACFTALHVNLLTSTETFSQTHWVPYGLIWGLAHRERGP